MKKVAVNVLVIDVGGTNIKILATGEKNRLKIPSGPKMTPRLMASSVQKLVAQWKYDVVSIGYPGPVRRGRPLVEPHNLGRGWVGFDYKRTFKRAVKVINDAAMQALGSYEGGKMLYLGLGTGLGTCLVVDGIVAPMELAHLPYKKATFEDYVGRAGLKRFGKKKWRKEVANVIDMLGRALEVEDIVLGGGNAKLLKKLPNGCRAGDNANAFVGGFRLWENPERGRRRTAKKTTKKTNADPDPAPVQEPSEPATATST